MDVTTTAKANISPLPTKHSDTDVVSNPKGILGKDDFMKLLLTELRYQDPTSPMDTEKMLTQTSQLATLEASDNTNKALEKLATTLTQTSTLGAISAIGKMAILKDDSFQLGKEGDVAFDIFLPVEVESATVEITDLQGNVISTQKVEHLPAGTHTFSWDGNDAGGNRLEQGSYTAKLLYTTADGTTGSSKVGAYPIESVRFEKDKAEVKVGNQYLSLDQIKEITGNS